MPLGAVAAMLHNGDTARCMPAHASAVLGDTHFVAMLSDSGRQAKTQVMRSGTERVHVALDHCDGVFTRSWALSTLPEGVVGAHRLECGVKEEGQAEAVSPATSTDAVQR